MTRLPSREELVNAGFPFGKASDYIPFGDPSVEWQRTNPDVAIYIPKEDMKHDCDNCVLAVTETPDGSELIAIWTQSSAEGFGDNRIVIARTNDGVNWSAPDVIIGWTKDEPMQSSWGMPMYSKSGRLYIFFIKETEDNDLIGVHSGALALMYSDDNGHTWSDYALVPLPRCKWDHPDPKKNKNWWSFQAPVRDESGHFVAGFTIETSPAILPHDKPYPHQDSHAAFIYFDNIDDDPDPCDVAVRILPNDGLSIPDYTFPEFSVAQEAAPVLLPDGRMFATMRNMSGFMQYSVWDGKVWSDPKPVIGHDGKPQPHPLSPCPIYRLKDGRYLCLTNNNPNRRGDFNWMDENCLPFTGFVVRNPLYLMVGVFDPDGEQPIRFGKPHEFMNSGDISVGFRKKSCTAPLYTAVTEWNGKRMFWYPERKYYILGKEIPDALLDEITPE